jgi:hypothetical protein
LSAARFFWNCPLSCFISQNVHAETRFGKPFPEINM